MIYLNLFWTFFKIGLFTFGGGYAMIPLIEQEVISLNWLTYDELYNYIGISEATPGPFAVNIATFVGATQGGFWGAVCATTGVVLPSFIIILIIASLFKKFSQNKYIKGTLESISPVVCGLILATGLLVAAKNFVINFGEWERTLTFDFWSLIIVAIIFVVHFVYNKITKKRLSPLLVILFSGILGIIMYSFY